MIQRENYNLPLSWKKVKFKDVFKVNQGLQIPIADRLKNQEENSFFYITNEFIKNRGNGGEEYYIKNPQQNVMCNKDDILMTRTGNTGIVVTNVEGVFHNNFFKISFDRNKLDKDYVYYYLNSPYVQKMIKTYAGTSTIPDLNHGDFYNIDFIMMDYNEQQKIASIITTWNKAIELKEKFLDQKREQKNGIMQNLLTGAIRLPGYSSHWKKTDLGNLGSFLKGKGISKSETIEEGIPCIRYGEIYTVHHFYIKQFCSFISKEVAEGGQEIFENDILFAGSGETAEEIGKAVAYIDNTPAYAGGDIIILRPNKEIDSLFLSYMLNVGEVARERAKLGQGNSVVHIYPKSLSSLNVMLPSYKEQCEISKMLKTADKEIDLLEQELEELQLQKKALMQLLLSGKVRVKV
jgi:type I restriction enzyme, S subunit